MVGLRLLSEALRSATRAAEEAYPEEACGFLLGADERPGSDRVIRRAVRTENRAPDRRRELYVIPADEIDRVHRVTHLQRDRVIGFFHSHPDRSVLPSRLDDAEALPRFVYLILSVIRGRVDFARAFELDPETETLRPLAHRVDPSGPGAPS